MTGWLSDTGCVTMRGWVCVNLFNNLHVCTCVIICVCVSVCPHGCPHGRFVTQTVCGHHFSLQRLSVSTSSYSPTHCQVPLISSLQLSCENVGPQWEEKRKRTYLSIMRECIYAHKGMWWDMHTFYTHTHTHTHTHSIEILKQFLHGRQSVKWLRLTEGNGA